MLEALSPYILFIHIGTVCYILILILWTDSLAVAWIRGKKVTLDKILMSKIHRYMWFGLGTMIGTGIMLFYPYNEYLLSHPPFLLKMGFVATLIVNGLFIGKLMHKAMEKSFAELLLKEKAPLFLSGAVSSLCWLGAIITAMMLNF